MDNPIKSYRGYEIDHARWKAADLPLQAELLHQCAFTSSVDDADLCIGNPPFVRNQDLPTGWRTAAAKVLKDRTGVSISGLANAWQYFFLLALASAKEEGLCALVMPYEWVTRPSSRALREHISKNKWHVDVYRLVDESFRSVMTTASITLIDKSRRDGVWRYFAESENGSYRELPSATASDDGVIPYMRRLADGDPRAVRGLSPGTQKVLTLTEGERVRSRLKIETDVVRCVTTLRPIELENRELDSDGFTSLYRSTGARCWLIRTDREPSLALSRYLESIDAKRRNTATCLARELWWKFDMPSVPDLLIAMSFTGNRPKIVRNTANVRAVGGGVIASKQQAGL